MRRDSVAGIRGDVPDGCSRAKLRVMKSSSPKSTDPLIAKIDQLFNCDLALENDYLRQENRILRSKFGRRVPVTEADRRILVKYGLRIKDRLREIVAIAKPETLLAWNRRQKKEKVDVPKGGEKTRAPSETGRHRASGGQVG